MRKLLKSTLAASTVALPLLLQMLLLLMSLASRPVTAHDLMGGGCLVADHPDMVRLVLDWNRKRPARPQHPFRYDPPQHVRREDRPVQGVHVALEGGQGLRVTWMNPAAAPTRSPLRSGLGGNTNTTFAPVCLYGARGSSLSRLASGYFYTYTAGELEDNRH